MIIYKYELTHEQEQTIRIPGTKYKILKAKGDGTPYGLLREYESLSAIPKEAILNMLSSNGIQVPA